MNDVKNFRFKESDLGKFAESSTLQIGRKFCKGCRIMGLTRGKFSLIDLIYEILKQTGKADVICTTWSAGIKDANNAKFLLDSGKINKFTLITDHSYKTRQKRYADSIEDLFGVENIRTSEIHAKFVLIKNNKYSVCIRTSMNLNANKTCESFEIDEDEEIYSFYNSFVSNVMENQREGFDPSSTNANKQLDLFFNTQTEERITGWSDS